MNQFGAEVSVDVMGRVTRERKRRGFSAQDLAGECSARGYTMARNVVANLESGRRTSLTVAELVAFSEVLEVPLLALLFDLEDLRAESVLALPSSRPATTWEELLQAQGVPPDDDDRPSMVLSLSRELESYESGMLAAHTSLSRVREDASRLSADQFAKIYTGRSPDTEVGAAEESLRYFAGAALGVRGQFMGLEVSVPPPGEDALRAYSAAGLGRAVDMLAEGDLQFWEVLSRVRHPAYVKESSNGDD